MSEHDEMTHAGREFGQLFRMGLQVAARLGEQMARAREQSQRDAQARSDQAAREATQRLTAERTAAEAQLRPVLGERWWDDRKPEQIADSYQQARAWRDHSPLAAQAADRIRDEVQTRYGIDVFNPGVDPRQIDKLLRDAEKAKSNSTDEQGRAAQDRLTASGLMAEADRLDRDQEDRERDGLDRDSTEPPTVTAEELRDRASAEYDSAERRDGLAEDLKADGVDTETVATRLSADLDQAKHPREAVHGPGKAPTARKGKPTKSRSVQRETAGR